MDLPLSAFEKAVVFILHIWAEPIEEKGLAEIVVLSEVFAPDPNNAIQNALRSLRERKIITCEGQKWGLTGRYDPQVLKVLSGIPDKLFYKNIIYNYLSQGKINHSELRYHLSKDLDCTTQTDAQLYLRHLLIQGKEVPHTVSVEANLKKGIRNDCLLSGITYCRERKYQAAFEWIDSIPSAQMTDDVEAFRAILLNRIRRSEEAEVAIMKCLEKTMEPSRQNILRAFLISTFIHMERLADAQKVYNNGKNLNSSSPLHGYLVRNATSAFSGYQKELYEEALSEFEHDGDDFGYYSTLCNQGYALCKNGDPHNALLLLNEAQKGLEFFPKTNLHIIYNNLGICHLMLDNYQDAYNFLFLARKLAANALPWIFATINLACLEAVMGKTENALLQLDSILLIDEAHNFGAENLRTMLNPKIEYRLALSATLERHGDPIGTQALYDYFGEKCIEYDLSRAIREGKLTPYYYFPKIVYLTESELELYRELSKKVAKQCHLKPNGAYEITEYGKKLLIERARLVAGASSKVELLRTLMEDYKHETHILVYCGATKSFDFSSDISERDEDGERQIVSVSKMLGLELGRGICY